MSSLLQNNMNFIAELARSAHAIALHDICAAAVAAGWRVELPQQDAPDTDHARLLLGRQVIPVYFVAAYMHNVARRLELLRRDILRSGQLEHYIVMSGFEVSQVRAYQAKFEKLRSRMVTVGTQAAYQSWLPVRLGPLAHLSVASPVRRLAEDLLCLAVAPEPAEKDPLTCEYKPSSIKKDFDYGQMGVQCAGTLFTYAKGPGAVLNLEGNTEAQKKGTDLDIASSLPGDQHIAVEVKTESYPSGRITLELHSCYEAKKGKPPLARTAGWLDTCKAAALMSNIWPTGDAIIIDFYQLLQWLSANPRKLKPRAGGTKANQDYISWILLAEMNDILEDIPGAVHLRLGDWLPNLYPGEFLKSSLVDERLGRTLTPQRIS